MNGELKDVADKSEIMKLLDGKAAKESMIHEAMTNPQFLALSGGGPQLRDSQGTPWTASYVTANGDLSVDLRSNMAAESRAKIVYEYLLAFTDDPYVQETLKFLMTREVAHFQMFEAALETIQPNFPQGVRQADPRYSTVYYNMSNGADARGPWNEGKSPKLGETWQYIEDPIKHVFESKGMSTAKPVGANTTVEGAEEKTREVSKKKSGEIRSAVPKGENQWSTYPDKKQRV